MNRDRSNRGFALPVAVFALVVVGVMVSGGFFLARQESRISVASDHAGQALYLAERGIEEVRLDWKQRVYNNMDLWTSRTLTGSTDDGDWEVVVTRTDTTNFFLESSGTITEGGSQLSGASRRVGLLLRVRFPEVEPPAALATVGTLNSEGRSTINGNDQDPAGWGGYCDGAENKTGVLVDHQNNLNQGGQSTIDGDPPTEQDPTMTSSDLLDFGEMDYYDLAAMADKVYTGNQEITNPGPVVDGDGDCDTSVKSNWGDPDDPTGACFHYFPMIHVQGSLTLNSSASGQGILLVDGDLVLKGGFEFYGVVIARGTLTTEGQGGHVNGGLIVANEDGGSSRAAGSSVVQHSTCAAARAIRNSQGASKPKPLSNRSWADLTAVSY